MDETFDKSQNDSYLQVFLNSLEDAASRTRPV